MAPTAHGHATPEPQPPLRPPTLAAVPPIVPTAPAAPDAASPGAQPWMSYLGTILVELGALTERDLERALESQRTSGKRLGTVLVEEGFVSEDHLVAGLARQLGLEVFDPGSVQGIEPSTIALLPEDFARRHSVIPVSATADTIVVAMADPVNLLALDDVTAVTQRVVRSLVGRERDIVAAIDRLYESARASDHLDDAMAGIELSTEKLEAAEDFDASQLRSAADDAPIVRLVSSLIVKAIQERATDIHIEALTTGLVVRYRTDGVLYDALRPPKRLHAALVSRIKVLSDLDIAERRVPQDGRFSVRLQNRKVDVRVSVMPTISGEKVVMRLLDKGSVDMRLESLGFSPTNLTLLREIIHRPWGMLVVSGPTGSGKTTTLYAALNDLVGTTTNIMTVEDPVEYQIERLNQVQVNEKSGMTFARALRAFLRQDPDVIMLGEIRDQETAEIAVRAALTGHFVLSTIHANDAVATATRLVDIGVETYLVASALSLVLAQRLVRRLCPQCRQPAATDDPSLVALGILPGTREGCVAFRPVGCHTCKGRGYSGRLAIHELLPMDAELRRLIAAGAPADDVRAAAAAAGAMSLRDSGVAAVLAGQTSAEEIVRVAMDPL